jgi:hypothetical protein
MDGEYIEMCLQAAKITADVRFGVKHERAMVELGQMREELYVLRSIIKDSSAPHTVMYYHADSPIELSQWLDDFCKRNAVQLVSVDGGFYIFRPTKRAADGACTCAKPSWVHDDGNTFYCSLCGKPPRR